MSSNITRIIIPLFDIEFYFSTNQKELCNEFQLEEIDCEGWSTLIDSKIIMYIRDASDYSILCHECFHAAMQVCKRVGVEITTDNDEVGAYLSEWFFNQVYNILNEKTNS